MKQLLLALVVAVATATVLTAQTTPVRPGTPGKAAPARKGEAEKEEPKIEGTELARPNGKFLGLTLHEGKFKLAFYDEQKEPMRVDALRAVARWPNQHGPGQNRTVLNPAGDGTYLLGALFVRGPHTFRLMITVVKSEDGRDVENYTVDFRG